MLRFNTWPPKAGEIEFAPDIAAELKNASDEEIRVIGSHVGSLLYVNIQPPSAGATLNIAAELARAGIKDPSTAEQFMTGVVQGVSGNDGFDFTGGTEQ